MSAWPHARSGYQRSHRLDDLRPDEEGGTTTTTVEGSGWEGGRGRGMGWLGRSSSGRGGDEKSENSAESGLSGISKTVGITYAEAPRLREGV
jgi:hypothetical protein